MHGFYVETVSGRRRIMRVRWWRGSSASRRRRCTRTADVGTASTRAAAVTAAAAAAAADDDDYDGADTDAGGVDARCDDVDRPVD